MTKYITVEELAELTHYSKNSILRGHISRNLIEGIHYVRPFGGKRKLFIWENIEKDMLEGMAASITIPMSKGGSINVSR